MTLKEITAEFPASSTALYVTVVLPIENQSPGLWLDVSVATWSSNAVGAVQETPTVVSFEAMYIVMSLSDLEISVWQVNGKVYTN